MILSTIRMSMRLGCENPYDFDFFGLNLTFFYNHPSEILRTYTLVRALLLYIHIIYISTKSEICVLINYIISRIIIMMNNKFETCTF